jgi:predicted adenine nucleotide alpha hydrolase (AANH) superfamily ATPase
VQRKVSAYQRAMAMGKPELLLHICCAPCSTHVVEVLKEDYNVTGYFYNPNIHPESEYVRREDEMKRYAQKIGLELVCAEYDDARWFEMVKGMEDVPEGGERCFLCYRMRLEKTAQYAEEHGYQFFTTTLSVSPHKNAAKINEIGSQVAGRRQLQFYTANFKKRGGFERRVRMSKEAGLYRQSYCGCIFSQREAAQRQLKRAKR